MRNFFGIGCNSIDEHKPSRTGSLRLFRVDGHKSRSGNTLQQMPVSIYILLQTMIFKITWILRYIVTKYTKRTINASRNNSQTTSKTLLLLQPLIVSIDKIYNSYAIFFSIEVFMWPRTARTLVLRKPQSISLKKKNSMPRIKLISLKLRRILRKAISLYFMCLLGTTNILNLVSYYCYIQYIYGDSHNLYHLYQSLKLFQQKLTNQTPLRLFQQKTTNPTLLKLCQWTLILLN